MNLDKFRGCVFAATCGDRLGVPFEKMNACDIRSLYGKIRDFRWGKEPSDDSQLLFATMDAFIASDGQFDMDAIAKEHVTAYENEWHGWGRSTRKSCKRMKESFGKKRRYDWENSGEPNGAGNGVMMKIPSLGLWQSAHGEDIGSFVEKCVMYGKMTHLGTPALVGGVVHAVAVATLASRQDAYAHIPTFLSFLRKIALAAEDGLPPSTDRISSQIQNILEYIEYGQGGRLKRYDPEETAKIFGGGGSYAFYSFGLSYAIWARSALNPDNPAPFEAVFDAVNAGGDTDTNASIVGSLVGALHGMQAIPSGFVDAIDQDGKIGEKIERFYKACVV